VAKDDLTKQDFFTSSEVDLLSETAYKKINLGKSRYSFEKHTNYALLLLLLKTGLRISEATSLTLPQAKRGVKDGELVMVGKGGMNTKNKTKIRRFTRTVYFNSELRSIISIYLENRRQADSKAKTLFIGRDGQPLNKFTAWHRFKTMCRQAGVEEKRTHATRHTCGMNLYEKTKDILTTSSILGHKDVRTTQVYVKATKAAKRKAVELI